MKSRNYIGRPAKIVAKSWICDNTVALTLKFTQNKPFNFIPGQFVMLSVAGFGEVPLGITSSSTEKHQIEVAVRNAGTVTEKITRLETGESLEVSGPFGNGLPLGKLKGKDVVIIAGGLGLPPLRSFIKYVGENPKAVRSLTILNGAKSPEDLLYRDEYRDWQKFATLHLTVDRCDASWKECVGQITKLFDQAKIKAGSVMLVCGPPAMFKPVIDRYAGKRVAEADLYLFLERRMHCGIGKCQHCTCGEKYVCLDGPVFPYSELKYNDEAFK